MKKSLFLPVCSVMILFMVIPGFSQTPKADSLHRLILGITKKDTSYINLLFSYTSQCFPVALDSFVKYKKIASELSKQQNYRKGIMKGLNQDAVMAVYQNHDKEGIRYYHQAMAIARETRDAEFQVKIKTNLGMQYRAMGLTDSAGYYLRMAYHDAKQLGSDPLFAKAAIELSKLISMSGDYLDALKYIYEGLAIFEKVHSRFDILSTYITIGTLYGNLKDFNKSLAAYRIAEKYNDTLKIPRIAVNINMNIGYLYENIRKNYDSAIYFLSAGLEQARKMNFADQVLVGNIEIGNIFFAQYKFREAIKYYNLAYEDPLLLIRFYERSAVLTNLGIAWLKLNNLGMAEKFLREGLAITEKNDYPEFQRIAYTTLASLLFKKGDYKNAYECISKAAKLADTLNSRYMKQQLNDLTDKFEKEKLEAKNLILVKDNEVKSGVIRQQRVIVISGIALLLAITALFIIYFRNHRKLQYLNKVLDEKNQNLIALNKTKDKFFSIISHDLRSPFQALLGFLTELDEQYESIDEEGRREIIATLRKSSQNTYALLVNLLDWALSQMEKKEYKPEINRVKNIVDEVFVTLHTRSSMKSHQLINMIPESLELFADSRAFYSLLINLVNNAVKFTPHHGTIRVYSEQSENKIKICVEDSGIGIPADQLSSLFRLDSSYKRAGTDKEPGTGLGLILCREYITAMGGEIKVNSKEGKGTTFSLVFTQPEG